MHKHAQNYYQRKENGKQYLVTQKQQCLCLLLLDFFLFSQGYGVILYKRYIKNAIPLLCAEFIRLQHQLVSESLDKYLNCYINDSDYKASPGYSKNKCSWTINPSNQMRILKSCGIYYVSLNRTNVSGEMVMIFSLL